MEGMGRIEIVKAGEKPPAGPPVKSVKLAGKPWMGSRNVMQLKHGGKRVELSAEGWAQAKPLLEELAELHKRGFQKAVKKTKGETSYVSWRSTNISGKAGALLRFAGGSAKVGPFKRKKTVAILDELRDIVKEHKVVPSKRRITRRHLRIPGFGRAPKRRKVEERIELKRQLGRAREGVADSPRRDNELDAAKAQVLRLQQQVDELQEELKGVDAARLERDEAKEQLEQARGNVGKLALQVASMQGRVADRDQLAAKLKKAEASVEISRRRAEDAEERAATAERIAEQLKGEIGDQREVFANQRAQFEKREEELTQQLGEIEQRGNEGVSVETQLVQVDDEIRTELARVKGVLDSYVDQEDQLIRETKAAIGEARGEVTRERERAEEAVARLEALQVQHGALQEKLAVQERSSKELEAKLKETEDFSEERRQYIVELGDRIEGLKEKLKQATGEKQIGRLEGQLKELQEALAAERTANTEKVREAGESKRIAAQLRKQVDELAELRVTMEGELERETAKIVHLRSLPDRVSHLEGELKRVEKELKVAEERREQVEGDNYKLGQILGESDATKLRLELEAVYEQLDEMRPIYEAWQRFQAENAE